MDVQRNGRLHVLSYMCRPALLHRKRESYFSACIVLHVCSKQVQSNTVIHFSAPLTD
uniref:Uncharacterized protein n=1 Tax=Arundo donax TaxID=35708 RepID=A0A0A9BQ15_ARUDO